MIESTALHGALTVHEVPPPPPPPEAILARVETLWQEERAQRGGALFEGRLFSLGRTSGSHLEVWEAPYRWWVAQRRQPSLRALLRVHPLAVTGICHLAGGYVLAQRSARTTQDPGLWEFAPAGGVADLCRGPPPVILAERQVLAELHEELNLDEGCLAGSPRPVFLLHDPAEGVTDVAYELSLTLTPGELEDRFLKRDSREYEALRICDQEGLRRWIATDPEAVSPAARAITPLLGAGA